MRKHVDAVHGGCEEGVKFEMKVTDIFKNDPTGRQVMEGVKMRETKADYLMNSKDEFHQPGEIIPVIEGPRWTNRNKRSNNDNRHYNNNNSQDNNSQEQGTKSSQNSQGVEGVLTRSRKKEVTRAANVTTGVTTRARARSNNMVV